MTSEPSAETVLDTFRSLRERKKNATRQAIEDAAWELFAERGYDATSVNDIAARANVAQRTFFRYFPVKEAVLFGELDEAIEVFAAAFRARPADEPIFTSMIAAFDMVSELFNKDRDRAIHRFEILHAAGIDLGGEYVQGRFVRMATELVCERNRDNPNVELQARLVAGVLMVVQTVAHGYWLEHGGIDSTHAGRMCVAELVSLIGRPPAVDPPAAATPAASAPER